MTTSCENHGIPARHAMVMPVAQPIAPMPLPRSLARASRPAIPRRSGRKLAIVVLVAGVAGAGFAIGSIDDEDGGTPIAIPIVTAPSPSTAQVVTVEPRHDEPAPVRSQPATTVLASPHAKLRPEHLEPVHVVAGDPTVRREHVRPRANAEAVLARAGELHIAGQLAEAAALYKQALAIDPGLARAHRGLGLAYQRLGLSTMAVASYRRYLRLAPRASDRTRIEQRIEQLGGHQP